MGGQPVRVVGPSDDISGGVIVVDFAHHEVHEGHMYQSSFKSAEGADIADNGTIRVVLTTGTRYNHTTFIITGGGDTEIGFYEGTVFTGGTPLSANSMNRNGTMTPVTAVKHTPTVSNVGTRIHNSLEPGGTGGAFTPGGSARADTEWILKRSTNYMVEGINRAGSSQPMSIIVQWYEEA